VERLMGADLSPPVPFRPVAWQNQCRVEVRSVAALNILEPYQHRVPQAKHRETTRRIQWVCLTLNVEGVVGLRVFTGILLLQTYFTFFPISCPLNETKLVLHFLYLKIHITVQLSGQIPSFEHIRNFHLQDTAGPSDTFVCIWHWSCCL
jgi:hypothetical protein